MDGLITALLIFLSVDALALLFLLFFHLRREFRYGKIRHYGDRAEERVKEYVAREFPGAILLDDIFLRTARSVTQIDHILLCKWGVFIIETKSHNGTIRTEKRNWVQFYGEKVVRFHSPLLQNEAHRNALIWLLKRRRARFRPEVQGVVVFTSKKVSLSPWPRGVVRLEELGPYVKSGGDTRSRRRPITAKPGQRYLSRKEMEELADFIRKNRVRDFKQKKKHEKTLRHLEGKKNLL
ncbi:MAG: NERD domain-containing protein [Clostridia bacterium]|nr:NERD domain-containing protein [Clostridia bacterium]